MTFYDTNDVARRFSVAERTVRRWIAAGRLEAINTGSAGSPRYRVSGEALERFVAGRRTA